MFLPVDKFESSPVSVNFHAVVMTLVRPFGLEIDAVRNPISGLAALLFVFILKFNVNF